MDLVKKINVASDVSNRMNDAWVAFINAGVVPGVNIDSHNSTMNAITRGQDAEGVVEKKCNFWGP